MQSKHTRRSRAAAFIVPTFVLIASCSSPLEPTSAATFTLTADGITPKEVRIKSWNHVTIINNDSRPHQIVSDPVDAHTDCPAINQVGYLPPGGSRDTRTMNITRGCGFHDHLNQLEDSFRGRIVVE